MYNLLRGSKYVAIFLSIVSTFSLYAQKSDSVKNVSPVLVTNHSQNGRSVIMVKWLTDKLIYPLGTNVYRQEFGEITWDKLTTKPLVKGMLQPSPSEYKADTTLRQYIEMAKDITPTNLKEMTKVFVLLKSVQSESFARYLGIQYTDTSIKQGITYRYKVIAITNKGEENIGHSEFIKTGSLIEDFPPSGIHIEASDQKVSIKWQPEDLRFHGVNIYRCSSGDTVMKRINKVPLMISKRELPNGKSSYPDEFFTDRKLQNRVKYTYCLTAIDFFGRESRFSDKISVTPGDKTPPLAPYSLNRKTDKYNVRLSWKNRPTADQEGINIYRSYKHDDQYVKLNSQLLPITDTSYTDKDLKAGFYYYIIAAIDSAGNEGKSSKTLAEVHDITPPSMPQHIVARADTGRILLSWDANTEPDLMGYQIFRTVDSDLKDYYVLLNAKPLKEPLFIDSLPRNARNHFLYKVTAVDSALNRSEYSPAVKAQMPDVTPPVQPVIIGASPKGEYLVVEWVPNRETDLAGYELFRTTGKSKEKEKVNANLLSPSVTRFTDRTILPDSLYYYTLQAIDSTGNHSISSKAFTGSLPHLGSTEDESEITKLTIKQPLFSKFVKLQWTARTSSSFIGYAVYRRSSPDAEPQRLCNLIPDNSFTDHDKKILDTQYQLRLYHKSGRVVKSQWVSQH